jgi:hypothetical protein
MIRPHHFVENEVTGDSLSKSILVQSGMRVFSKSDDNSILV